MEWTYVVSAIAAAISAIAAAFASYFAFKKDKPKFSISIDERENQEVPSNGFFKNGDVSVALTNFQIYNSCPHPITLAHCDLEVGTIKFMALQKDEQFNFSLMPTTISENGLPISTSMRGFPITIPPYQYVDTIAIFPKFMNPNKKTIKANLRFHYTFRIKPFVLRNIPFFDLEKTKNVLEHNFNKAYK